MTKAHSDESLEGQVIVGAVDDDRIHAAAEEEILELYLCAPPQVVGHQPCAVKDVEARVRVVQLQSILRASNESGQTWDDPSEDLLFILLEDIDRGDQTFLIVERLTDSTGQTHIQSARNDDGTYVIEHRKTVADMRAAHTVVIMGLRRP